MKTRHIIIFILLLAIASGIYAASLSNQFVYDDRYTVAENTYIKDIKFLPLLFKTTLMHFQYGKSGQDMFYRPIQGITYMLDYLLWGLDTTGYHITNILWHSIVAFLVYLLTMLLFQRSVMSMLAAVLFIIHPIHTEAVMYISGRADSLVSAFILIYLIYFLKDIGRARKTTVFSGEFLFAQCALFAAFLSKEIALISLPLLLLVFYVY